MPSRDDFTVGCRFGEESTDFSPRFWLASAPHGHASPVAYDIGNTTAFKGLFVAYPMVIGISLLLAFLVERNLFSPI